MNRLQLRHVLCPMDLSSPSMNSLEWATRSRAREARSSGRFMLLLRKGSSLQKSRFSRARRHDEEAAGARSSLSILSMPTPEQL